MPLSRQDKLRSIFANFADGAITTNDKLVLKLYPPELNRFRNEFPQLNFKVNNTVKTACSKKHEVTITIN